MVGGGPAGLNAALVLGRARRRVLVLDGGAPRNQAAHAMHGVLGHDGLDPAELRDRGRAELARYGVEVEDAGVEDAESVDGGVRLTWDGGSGAARTVVLATGMLDELPAVPGFAEVWGTSAHTCPYCDGWEHRDERLAVLAAGERAAHLTTMLRQWSADVVLLTGGPHGVASEELARLEQLEVPIVEAPVERLESEDGALRRVHLAGGAALERDALFFYVGWRPRTDLARQLGCAVREDGSIVVDDDRATDVDRVYAAGNCADMMALVPVAAADGVRAAVAINTRLTFEAVDPAD